jgi:predicted sulfurtransferase
MAIQVYHLDGGIFKYWKKYQRAKASGKENVLYFISRSQLSMDWSLVPTNSVMCVSNLLVMKT